MAIDRKNLEVAAKLLAKAQDTSFDAEAAAFAEKAYVLLAEFLNAYESENARTGATRRRERRQLRDRRAAKRVFGWWAPGRTTDPAMSYRRAQETPAPPDGDIDLRA